LSPGFWPAGRAGARLGLLDHRLRVQELLDDAHLVRVRVRVRARGRVRVTVRGRVRVRVRGRVRG
tara:strand:- start:549 stop:743 length:195 start_codon:yes stop_codon:yes gene_type:complete